MKVDLNVDIGEGLAHDEQLLEFATSANVCCGAHAGSWELTKETIDMCVRKGIRVGCHPGFPDRAHFGRRMPKREEINDYTHDIKRQVLDFYGYLPAAYIKPHGALYHVLSLSKSSKDTYDAGVFGGCIGMFFGLTVCGTLRPDYMLMPGSTFGKTALMMLLKVFKEGFADRRYQANGALVPRSEPNAVLEDPKEIAAQVLSIAPKVDSICLHGDTPNCLEFAELVNKTLVDAHYEVGF